MSNEDPIFNDSLVIAATFLTLLVAPPALSKETSQTIYATPHGGRVIYQGQALRSHTLNTALKKSRPGDRVLLLPGQYRRALTVTKEGTEPQPITIQGLDGAVISCATSTKSSRREALKLTLSKWIHLKNLTFSSCPYTAVSLRDSAHIRISDTHFMNTRVAVSAAYQGSKSLLIEGSSQKGGDAFLLAQAVSSDIVLQDNTVSATQAFVRFETAPEVKDVTTTDILIRRNTLTSVGEIVHAAKQPLNNLALMGNQLVEVEAIISLADTHTDRVMLFGNVAEGQGNHRLELIRLSGASKIGHAHIVSNTWFSLDKLFADPAQLEKVSMWNNVFAFQDPALPFVKSDKRRVAMVIDHNLSNRNLKAWGTYNRTAPDIAAKPTSPHTKCRDSGRVFMLTKWRQPFRGNAPDIGAYEHGTKVSLPPFAYSVQRKEEEPHVIDSMLKTTSP